MADKLTIRTQQPVVFTTGDNQVAQVPEVEAPPAAKTSDGIDPRVPGQTPEKPQGAQPDAVNVESSPGLTRVQQRTGALLNPVGNLSELSKALTALDPQDRVAGAAVVLDAIDGLTPGQQGQTLRRLLGRVGAEAAGPGGLAITRDVRAALVHQYLLRLPADTEPDARVLAELVNEPTSRLFGPNRKWPEIRVMPRDDYSTRSQHVLDTAAGWNPGRSGAELRLFEIAQSLGYAGVWVDHDNDGTVFAASFPDAEGEIDFVELGNIDKPVAPLNALYGERFGIAAAAEYRPFQKLDPSIAAHRQLIDAHMAALAYLEPEAVVAQLRAWGFGDGELATFQFVHDAKTDTQGFRVIKDGVLYDVGRGTASGTDAKTDADFGKVQVAWLPRGIKTHGGFTRAAMADIRARAEYLAELPEASLHHIDQIAFSGHSLGASYKTISAAWMMEALSHDRAARRRALAILPRSLRHKVAHALSHLGDCRMRATFLGSPRAGNRAFAAHLNQRVADLGDRSAGFVRFRYGGDLVTRVPPAFLGFAHAFDEQQLGPVRRTVLPLGVEGPEEILRSLDPEKLEQVLELAFLPEEEFTARLGAERRRAGDAQARGIDTVMAFGLAKIVRDSLDHRTTNYLHALNARSKI